MTRPIPQSGQSKKSRYFSVCSTVTCSELKLELTAVFIYGLYLDLSRKIRPGSPAVGRSPWCRSCASPNGPPSSYPGTN